MSVTGRVVIPKLTPSLNELRRWDYQAGRTRSSWRMKRAINTWAGYLRATFGGGRNRVPMTVRIESHRVKVCDPDNLKGGMKPLLDALVKVGLLVDDSPEWLYFPDPLQVRVRHLTEQGTVVSLSVREGEGAPE